MIVLDDYHLIESRTIHEALAFLIEHLHRRCTWSSPRVRTRPCHSPGFARGEMAELRASDLRFTTEETTASS